MANTKYKMPYAGTWIDFTDADLKKLCSEGKEATAEILRARYDEYESNRLSFFLAHSGGVDFVNDRDSEVCILFGGNQQGKTIGLLGKAALILVPTSPNWPCYVENGLDYHEWEGPQKVMLCSYEMMVHCRRNLWPKLREILPEYELKEYSIQWARKHSKRAKEPNWQTGPILNLDCGSEAHFYAYRQPPEAYEGTTYDKLFADEQMPWNLLQGAMARGTTAENFQVNISATPHKVAQRPDTGTGGWMHGVYTGVDTKGLDAKFYRLMMDEVPDAIVPPKKKKQNYRRWIEAPTEAGDLKELRKGRSRYYGEFETGEGLVYDAWDSNIHLIDPIEIQPHWTRVRAVDHGKHHPWAGLMGAITERGELVLYDEYYKTGFSMQKNVNAFVDKCGNELVKVDEIESEEGVLYPIYEEIQHVPFDITVMDGRSWAQPSQETGETLGEAYDRMGLACEQGSGMRNEKAIPMVSEWFELNEEREHLLIRMGLTEEIIGPGGLPLQGAPRIYVFNTMTRFRGEIEGYIYKPDSEVPMDKNDHLMTALKYLILAEPRYLGDRRVIEANYDADVAARLAESRDRFAYST